ncbi:MAG: hypothetical protein LBS84_09940 [Clostridiales bacterium]|nr:hypothetical protein [Clostridiales bacterium]
MSYGAIRLDKPESP